MKITRFEALEKISNEIRVNIVKMVYNAQSGHLGGSLSCAEILTVLYFNQMNINPQKPDDNMRDRFVLSKGHCTPALYSVLARKGYFKEENLSTFRKINSQLQGHPDMNKVPGVDMSSGSLGQGLSIANGMAISSKMDSMGYRVYCLLGDGEIEEGQIWEAAMTSAKYKLDNLCVIVDNNNLQIDGEIQKVKGLNRIEQKFESFGFNVITADVHNIQQLVDAFDSAKMTKDMPTAIIAKTVKGKGVSFMENNASWHGKAPNQDEYNKALQELNNNL